MSHKTRTIRNALARLGMQASPATVVAALAESGIAVTEELVRRVKVELLKAEAQANRQRVKTPIVGRPKTRRPPKVPPRRGHRP